MKKLYTYLILPVLVALCVSACSESEPVVQAAHGAVTLVVKHTAPKFNIPVFTGANIRGTVTWGDGAQEDYQKGLSHEYAEQKEYTTTISITGVEAVELENISGIAEIDFTGF